MGTKSKLLIAGLILLLVAVFFLLPSPMAVQGVGVQDAVVADPADKPLAVRIWYPAGPENNARINGNGLPLIVMSHGTGGNLYGHADTAIALAKAGFVVAALTHTGDNFMDRTHVDRGDYLIERPRHIALLIDYMLGRWTEHSRLDPARIGMFGHSAGGFTAMVIAGGVPDMSRTIGHCHAQPKAWDCQYWQERHTDLTKLSGRGTQTWVHDPRVKAAVVAAPAVGYVFEPEGLSEVHIPIQMWEAQHDDIVADSPSLLSRLLPQAPDFHRVAGAQHLSFLAPCGWRERMFIRMMGWFGTTDICSDRVGFDREKFHSEFNKAVVSYFEKTLAKPGE